jgi:Bifunctional DNA primase/polymerase, N-terminal
MIDFVTIATPLVERGFRVTPVSPETKMGVMKNWTNWQITTPDEVVKYSTGKYAHHNVGVVGKRGVGRDMFLDIDADGVVERIEAESKHKMPTTYTVASRPGSVPFKLHFYFKQTMYSWKMFAKFVDSENPWLSKNVNVRDLSRLEKSKSGQMLHPTLYDVKGIGGGALVVGAGSVRDTGEIYTCVTDAPVIDIPDWLVDWLVRDIKRYLADKQREKEAKARERVATGTIAVEDIYAFLNSRAGSLASLGHKGLELERNLVYQVKTFCDGGEGFAESESGQRLIRKIAANDWTFGNASWFYLTGDKKTEGMVIYKRPSKFDSIVEVMQTFPKQISVADAFTRIAEEMALHGFPFDRRKDKDALLKARKRAGLTVSADGLYWERAAEANEV